MAQRRTTDYGTVILHASLVFSFAVLVATGLRVAADDPDSEWLAVLDPLLPVEEVWYYHLISGVVLMATLAGYFFYLRRAKLQSRVRFDKARFVVLLRPGRQRWAALNVIVYWVLMVSLVVEVVSGIMLFAGAGSPHLAIHRITTYVCVASVITHVALHAVAGGIRAAYASCSPRPAAHRTAAAGSGRVASSRVVAAHRKRARAGGGEFGHDRRANSPCDVERAPVCDRSRCDARGWRTFDRRGAGVSRDASCRGNSPKSGAAARRRSLRSGMD